jgi:C1A family cysteine protease
VILTFINVVESECCNGRMGKSRNGWSRYSTPIKNQQGTGLCWAYSTMSYIELMYNYQTGKKCHISMEEFKDDLIEYYSNLSNDCKRMTFSSGGAAICALDFVQNHGIMTAYTYTIKNEFDKNKTLQLNFSKYVSIKCNGKPYDECINLTSHTYLMVICSENLNYIKNHCIISECKQTHAVLVTDICDTETGTYIEYQNSWGIEWGECGGYGYINIDDNCANINGTRTMIMRFTSFEMNITNDLINMCNHAYEKNIKITFVTISILTFILLLITIIFSMIIKQ